METRSADVIVLGAGVAGLRAVLALEPLRVALVTKTMLGVGGSSPCAQGGVAAALDRDDSPRLHADDTLAVGGGLDDPAIVRVLTERAPRRDRAPGRRRDPLRSRRRRLARAGPRGRRTSAAASCTPAATPPVAEMVRALSEAVAQPPGVAIRERPSPRSWWSRAAASSASSSMLADGRRAPAHRSPRGGPRHRRRRPALSLHHQSVRSSPATAWRWRRAPGARLVDLEFVQFHPTALAAGARSDAAAHRGAARRGRGADRRDRRALPARRASATPSWRRATWWRAPSSSASAAGHRVFLDARAALGERIRAALPHRPQELPGRRHRSRASSRFRWRRPPTTSWAASWSTRAAAPRCRACGPAARCPPPARTAPTGWPPTRCSKRVVFGSVAAADARAAIGAAPAPDEEDRADRARGPEPVRVAGSWSDDSPAEPRRRLRESMWDRVGIVRDARRPRARARRHRRHRAPARRACRRAAQPARGRPSGRDRGPGAARDPRQPRALGLSVERRVTAPPPADPAAPAEATAAPPPARAPARRGVRASMTQRGKKLAAVRHDRAAARQQHAAARQERPLRHPDRLLYETCCGARCSRTSAAPAT